MQSANRAAHKLALELPKKYENLSKFFDSMESSIRLLRLKRTLATFNTISKSVEVLTERRFSYRHLAQLKYIYPEVIHIKKIIVHDEKTLCMKPELQITLEQDGPNSGGKKKNSYPDLRKVLRNRLLEFFKDHPQGDDIPEGLLPEPFNQTAITMPSKVRDTALTSSSSLLSPACVVCKPSTISHLPSSFQRRFSHKKAAFQSLEDRPDQFATPFASKISVVQSPCAPMAKLISDQCSPLPTKKSAHLAEEESRKLDDCSSKVSNNASPPTLVPTPVRLMTRTPDIKPVKRCSSTPDESPVQTIKRVCPRRTLNFPPATETGEVEHEQDEKASSYNEDVLNILPKSLLQSVRAREKLAKEARDSGIYKIKKRKQMISSLPKLFDMVHLIFQSANKSVLTKQDLIHKIILHHIDIIDKKELEEQMNLLQELLPDWISEKILTGGESVICINKASSAEIHLRLAQVSERK